MPGSRTKYRGFINYVAQVHDEDTRNSSSNFYGTNDLGKSRASLYTNSFNHPEAITKQTERNIVDRFYEGRDFLASSNAADECFNPDFPNGYFSYGYVKTKNNLFEIGVSQNQGFRGDQISQQSANISVVAKIRPEENTVIQEGLNTSDGSGKYTPNLHVSVDFDGQGLQNRSRQLNGSGGGGYGHSLDNMSNEPAANQTNKVDIHHNTFFGNPDDQEFTNIRGDVVNNFKGVITVHEEGRLGSFSEGVEKDGGAYEDTLTIQ